MRAAAADLERRRRGAETKVDTYPEPQKKIRTQKIDLSWRNRLMKADFGVFWGFTLVFPLYFTKGKQW